MPGRADATAAAAHGKPLMPTLPTVGGDEEDLSSDLSDLESSSSDSDSSSESEGERKRRKVCLLTRHCFLVVDCSVDRCSEAKISATDCSIHKTVTGVTVHRIYCEASFDAVALPDLMLLHSLSHDEHMLFMVYSAVIWSESYLQEKEKKRKRKEASKSKSKKHKHKKVSSAPSDAYAKCPAYSSLQ